MSRREEERDRHLPTHLRRLSRDVAYTDGHAEVMRAAADYIDRLTAIVSHRTAQLDRLTSSTGSESS